MASYAQSLRRRRCPPPRPPSDDEEHETDSEDDVTLFNRNSARIANEALLHRTTSYYEDTDKYKQKKRGDQGWARKIGRWLRRMLFMCR